MYGIKGLSRCLSVILLFALSIYSPAAYPQQFIAKNGEIRGTVYGQEVDPESSTTLELIELDPLANATVRLVETGQSTLTDENGEFRFDDLPPGDYTLNVTAIGYRLLEEDNVAMVKAGEITEVKISLAPVSVTLDEVEVKSSSIPAAAVNKPWELWRFGGSPAAQGTHSEHFKPCRGLVLQRFRRSTLYSRRLP